MLHLYMHIMAQHLQEFLKMYGNLVQFTQYGMEKLNDQTILQGVRITTTEAWLL